MSQKRNAAYSNFCTPSGCQRISLVQPPGASNSDPHLSLEGGCTSEGSLQQGSRLHNSAQPVPTPGISGSLSAVLLFCLGLHQLLLGVQDLQEAGPGSGILVTLCGSRVQIGGHKLC